MASNSGPLLHYAILKGLNAVDVHNKLALLSGVGEQVKTNYMRVGTQKPLGGQNSELMNSSILTKFLLDRRQNLKRHLEITL